MRASERISAKVSTVPTDPPTQNHRRQSSIQAAESNAMASPDPLQASPRPGSEESRFRPAQGFRLAAGPSLNAKQGDDHEKYGGWPI